MYVHMYIFDILVEDYLLTNWVCHMTLTSFPLTTKQRVSNFVFNETNIKYLTTLKARKMKLLSPKVGELAIIYKIGSHFLMPISN
jgi:hypothetical protein